MRPIVLFAIGIFSFNSCTLNLPICEWDSMSNPNAFHPDSLIKDSILIGMSLEPGKPVFLGIRFKNKYWQDYSCSKDYFFASNGKFTGEFKTYKFSTKDTVLVFHRMNNLKEHGPLTYSDLGENNTSAWSYYVAYGGTSLRSRVFEMRYNDSMYEKCLEYTCNDTLIREMYMQHPKKLSSITYGFGNKDSTVYYDMRKGVIKSIKVWDDSTIISYPPPR